MDRYALPFLAGCVFLFVLFAILAERRSDKREADRKKQADLSAEKLKRTRRSR